jgi:PAS domain S-box-containing protein
MRHSSVGDGSISGPGEDVRVIHVDDDAAFADLTARQLERADGTLTVVAESDPTRVLDRLADESFDAVVSDHEMPGLTGLELLREVRASHGDLPFVLFTASGSEAVASEAIAAGVTDYIQKGREAEQYAVLANRIRNAVDGARERARADDLERVNRLIRRLNRRIARLDSAGGIERTICETIAGAEPYRFAWLGDRDEPTDEIRVRATGGDATDYVDAVDIRADESPQGGGPAGRAVRTGETQVAQAIPEDPTFAPWRDAAADYGFRSVAVLPLQGPASWHGILAVYADRRDAFDEGELTVLEELADTIAGALDGAAARRRLERRERELERYENIVEASGDPVYVIDDEGRFRYVNDRLVQMTGYDEATLVGETVDIVLPPDDVAQGEALIRSLLESGGQRGTYEMTIVTADGERRACENHVSLLPFEESFRGTVGVVRDISRRKERERELERQNERLEEFASVVSHDLRNPLNVVRGSVDLAQATDDVDELDRARRGVERMRTLIDDLLTLAQEGKAVSTFEPVALGEVATEAAGLVEAPAVEFRIDSQQTVFADATRLRQLFENLFANAVDHGRSSQDAGQSAPAVPAGGSSGGGDSCGDRLVVTVEPLAPGRSGFSVADNGTGIPPERRELVFQEAYSTSDDGTGFGLRIVQRIAEAHGWDVTVTDSAAGGARFEFTGVDVID